MSPFEEANIQATIVAFKARAARSGELPVRVALVKDDEVLSAHAWRSCAIEYLEKREAAKQLELSLHVP
jgi:hypothetical protein